MEDLNAYASEIRALWVETNPLPEDLRLIVSVELPIGKSYDGLVFLELKRNGKIVCADALLATPEFEVPLNELREWLTSWVKRVL